jgi:hypothetical protein
MKKKLRNFGTTIFLKEKNWRCIIGVLYVGHFCVWITMEKWHLMHLKSCIVCCLIPIIYICNLRKKLRKGLIFYYKTSGITCLRKHIDANHSIELLKKTNWWRNELYNKRMFGRINC